MRKPVQERSRDSTERVLDAVLRILAEHGLGALTTARVAAESGVSNGSIYHRFATRGALLEAALQRFTAQIDAESAALRTATPEPPDLPAAVKVLVASYQALFAAHGELIRAFFVDALSDADLAARAERDKLAFAQRVAEFLGPYSAEISAPRPEHTFEMTHRLLFGYFMLRTLFHDGHADDAMLASMRDAVLGMLRPG